MLWCQPLPARGRFGSRNFTHALNSAAGLSISNEAYTTVGGWVLDLFGRVPRKGERWETSELVVTVEKVERTRVIEVLVALRKPVSAEAAA